MKPTGVPETLVVFRCPDRETADRVMGALRKQSERVQDTSVAIAPSSLTAIERRKLEEQGIILGHVHGGQGADTQDPREASKRLLIVRPSE